MSQVTDRMAETVPTKVPSFGRGHALTKEQRRAEIDALKPPPEPEEWRSDGEDEKKEDAAAIRARRTAKLRERSVLVRPQEKRWTRRAAGRRAPRDCTP